MKITIKSTDVHRKDGTSKRTGNPYTLFTQQAEAETPAFRQQLELTLGDDGKAYPVGVYDLDWDASVRVSQYGDLQFNRQLVLVPRTAAKAA